MKKFSKILEKNDSKKYKIRAYIELEVSASNEGEASFIADKFLSETPGHQEHSISKVEAKEEKLNDESNI